MKTHIESYHFGFVVCDSNGVALSQAFKTLIEAESFQAKYQAAVKS